MELPQDVTTTPQRASVALSPASLGAHELRWQWGGRVGCGRCGGRLPAGPRPSLVAMELLPLTFASGWACGLNAYATVLVLGLLGRFAHLAQVPDGLQRTDVLLAAGVLAVLELVADKVPLLDSAWDTVSTAIRPVAGAVVAALLAGSSDSPTTLALAAVGGTTALLSHLAKSGLRMAINTSPEPVSNVTASVANDACLLTVLTVAASHPTLAAALAGVLLAAGLLLCLLVQHHLRQGLRRLTTRLRRADGAAR